MQETTTKVALKLKDKVYKTVLQWSRVSGGQKERREQVARRRNEDVTMDEG